MPVAEAASAAAIAVVERARLALGTRFRPQGRSLQHGFDCVGLVAFAFDAAPESVPAGYGLRSAASGTLPVELRRHGLVLVPNDEPRSGDLGVFAPGLGQVHLAILTGGALIHADAALRKVVERPLPAPWPRLGLWRLDEGQRRD